MERIENDRIDRSAENPLLLFVKLSCSKERGPEIKVFYPKEHDQQQLETIKRYAFPFDMTKGTGQLS